ncbi:MAG: non-oxidative hydroxyarylic acid decarboxylases subunit D [Alphaproteobacteria bacterium]
MTPTKSDTAPQACPRCRATEIEVRSTSPVAGIWSLYACTTCLYVWRSTEPEENRDPDKYPVPFRLNPEDLRNLPVAPAIPPLRPRK